MSDHRRSRITEARNPRPDLSVVVAVWNDTEGLDGCLAALSTQLDDGIEVLVSGNIRVEPEVRASFEWATWLDHPADSLVPVLWSLGIERSRGDRVALTTSHFAPRDDWVAEIRGAVTRLDAVAIGGAIDPPVSGGPVAWATYYLRYSNYFHLDSEQIVGEIAGDNAVYRRDALERHWAVIADGFWEPDFHRVIRAEGHDLIYAPTIRVRQIASSGISSFCRQRFHHGTQFGSARVRGRSALERAARLATAPAVPVVFLAKICARALRRPRDLARFLGALPVLAAFILCWAIGEARGYMNWR